MTEGVARTAGRGRGQSTVEFSLVFLLFLTMLLAVMDSWIWTIEIDAADAAVEQGVGVALSALGSATSPTPALGDVYADILPILQPPLLGTSVDDWYGPRLADLRAEMGPTQCPTADQVADYFNGLRSGYDGVGHVVVCAIDDGAGHVTVTVAGYAVSFVPPGLGPLNWRGWGLPVSESASVDIGTYAP
ncbi:MAG: TadE/TadG family type IV pilus assembly protein [Candidatus Dormibacteria bacterium]